MTHAFKIYPDVSLLKKYGYAYINPLEIEPVWTKEQRQTIEVEFAKLTSNYELTAFYDTLLYIVLIEHNHADIRFQHYNEVLNHSQRTKELAQLLLLLNPKEKHKPSSLKISSVTQTVTIQDSKIMSWIGNLINNSITNLDFSISELGEEALTFGVSFEHQTDNAQFHLDYEQIQFYANRKLNKRIKREKNKVLAPFLLKVLYFLNSETPLCTPPTVRFTDRQLNFLYSLAVMLEWLNHDSISSDGKDYLGTLLLNFIGK